MQIQSYQEHFSMWSINVFFQSRTRRALYILALDVLWQIHSLIIQMKDAMLAIVHTDENS